jgi:hypothetical protein
MQARQAAMAAEFAGLPSGNSPRWAGGAGGVAGLGIYLGFLFCQTKIICA